MLFGPWERNETEKKICKALETVAAKVGAKHVTAGAFRHTLFSPITFLNLIVAVIAVAIAYVMHKAPYVFPIVGARKVEHMQANLEALNISLSDENVKFIDEVLPFDKGFPSNFFVRTSSASAQTYGSQQLISSCTSGRVWIGNVSIHSQLILHVRSPTALGTYP